MDTVTTQLRLASEGSEPVERLISARAESIDELVKLTSVARES